ncbi:MAG: helix-turn-helix domain-containing protein [Clostridium sp.]
MGASKQIKIALIETKTPQKELAEKLNITSATISKMLKNDNIHYNRAEEIADILGYDIIWKKRK